MLMPPSHIQDVLVYSVLVYWFTTRHILERADFLSLRKGSLTSLISTDDHFGAHVQCGSSDDQGERCHSGSQQVTSAKPRVIFKDSRHATALEGSLQELELAHAYQILLGWQIAVATRCATNAGTQTCWLAVCTWNGLFRKKCDAHCSP